LADEMFCLFTPVLLFLNVTENEVVTIWILYFFRETEIYK